MTSTLYVVHYDFKKGAVGNLALCARAFILLAKGYPSLTMGKLRRLLSRVHKLNIYDIETGLINAKKYIYLRVSCYVYNIFRTVKLSQLPSRRICAQSSRDKALRVPIGYPTVTFTSCAWCCVLRCWSSQ